MSKSYNGSGKEIGDAILSGFEKVIARTIMPEFKELNKKQKTLAAEMAQVRAKIERLERRGAKRKLGA